MTSMQAIQCREQYQYTIEMFKKHFEVQMASYGTRRGKMGLLRFCADPMRLSEFDDRLSSDLFY